MAADSEWEEIPGVVVQPEQDGFRPIVAKPSIYAPREDWARYRAQVTQVELESNLLIL